MDGGSIPPGSTIASRQAIDPMQTAAAVNSPPRRAGGGLRYALMALLLAIAGLSLWTWLTLSWAYSDGVRAGILQKFTHRGWLCKTHEGDLVLAQFPVAGVAPQIWQFSVRDQAVGAQIERAVGAHVQLHYTEHPGVPSTCFADTRYFVDRITVIDENPMGNGAPGNAVSGGEAPSAGSSSTGAPGAAPSRPQPLSPGPPPTVPSTATPPNP
jgi:hypothetical protein